MFQLFTCNLQSGLPSSSSLTAAKSEVPSLALVQRPTVFPTSTTDPSGPAAAPYTPSVSSVSSCASKAQGKHGMLSEYAATTALKLDAVE